MRTGGTPILGKAPYLYHYIYVYIYNIHIYIYTWWYESQWTYVYVQCSKRGWYSHKRWSSIHYEGYTSHIIGYISNPISPWYTYIYTSYYIPSSVGPAMFLPALSENHVPQSSFYWVSRAIFGGPSTLSRPELPRNPRCWPSTSADPWCPLWRHHRRVESPGWSGNVQDTSIFCGKYPWKYHWFPLGKIYRKEFWPLKWSPVSGCNVRMSMVNSKGFGFLVWDENRIYAG